MSHEDIDGKGNGCAVLECKLSCFYWVVLNYGKSYIQTALYYAGGGPVHRPNQHGSDLRGLRLS